MPKAKASAAPAQVEMPEDVLAQVDPSDDISLAQVACHSPPPPELVFSFVSSSL